MITRCHHKKIAARSKSEFGGVMMETSVLVVCLLIVLIATASNLGPKISSIFDSAAKELDGQDGGRGGSAAEDQAGGGAEAPPGAGGGGPASGGN